MKTKQSLLLKILRKKIFKAFTLVELIVVVLILSILWTIAFIAMQWYSRDARDSARLADLDVIKKSLELHIIKTGTYPLPTDWVEITYSWAEVRTQWVIWKSVTDLVDWLRDKRELVDPLTSLPYTYSRLNTWKEYEVAAIMEWEIAMNDEINLINKTYAANQLATAYVKWTYNGVAAKVKISWTTYTLAVPTIISWDLTLTDLLELQAWNRMVYHWKNNLPDNYKNSQFKVDWWWFEFNPDNIVAYTWTMESLKEDTDNQITLLKNLQEIYSWSEVVLLDDTIEDIVNTTINENTPSDEAKLLASIVIKDGLNPSVDVYESSLTSVENSPYPITAFVSQRKTDNSWISNDNQIKLPLQSNWTYNFTVDWWDWNTDTITTRNQAETTHNYLSTWTYDIIIDWTIEWFAFNAWTYSSDDLDDWDKLLDIKQWGNLKLSDWWEQFSNVENLIITANDQLDVSNITDMSYMFAYARYFNWDIWDWDVHNVTDMKYMFSVTNSFNWDIWDWNVSNVTDMKYMFWWSKFNWDIWDWDVSNVTDMTSMFSYSRITDWNIWNWDVQKVKFMNLMFYHWNQFNWEIWNWNVSSVTNMGSMFYGADSFDKDIWNWDVSSVTNMSSMFRDANLFNQDLSSWCVTNISYKPSYFDYATPTWEPKTWRQPIWWTCP